MRRPKPSLAGVAFLRPGLARRRWPRVVLLLDLVREDRKFGRDEIDAVDPLPVLLKAVLLDPAARHHEVARLAVALDVAARAFGEDADFVPVRIFLRAVLVLERVVGADRQVGLALKLFDLADAAEDCEFRDVAHVRLLIARRHAPLRWVPFLPGTGGG